MLLLPTVAMIGEFETLLSSRRAGLIAAAGLPELELFGQRTRLLLVGEPGADIASWPALKMRASRTAKALGKIGVTPMLVTSDPGSPLATALRDAGWGVFRQNGDGHLRSKGILEPMPATTSKAAANRKLSLLCALWHLRHRLFTAAELGTSAGISATAARTAISNAMQSGWANRDHHARAHRYRLDAPHAILQSLHQSTSPRPGRWQHFSLAPDHLAALPQRLDGFCRAHRMVYAVTGQYAATYFLGRRQDVPELQVRLAPSAEFADLLSHLRATPATAPANLAVAISADAASWLHRRRVHDLNLANPLVVMSDLISLNGPETDAFSAWLEAEAGRPESSATHP
jgi:hypothetical protein